MKPKTLISAAIDPDVRDELERRARVNDRSVSHELRRALSSSIDTTPRVSLVDAVRDAVIARIPDTTGFVAPELRREAKLRATQHTLSEDTSGLLPAQHVSEIMGAVDGRRPVIATARRVQLTNQDLTYPDLEQSPEVIAQAVEKTEGGTIEMKVDMKGTAAQTFIAGGNMSWQTFNWDRITVETWISLAAESYAKQSDRYVASVLPTAGTITAPISTSSNLSAWMGAIAEGAQAIYDVDGHPSALYAPHSLYLGLVKAASEVGEFDLEAGTGRLEGLDIVATKGISHAVLGDASTLLVAELPRPVELRALEPDIGGIKIGLIGAIAAVAVDSSKWKRLS